MNSTFIFCEITLILGFMLGWFVNDRFSEYLAKEAHEFDQLFKNNPHPEIFDENGKVVKDSDYMTLVFDPGFDPDDYDPENDLIEP